MEKAWEINTDESTYTDTAVLCFLRDRRRKRLLLIHKKTGLGAGLINAPGGRIEPGETPEQAAVRETREEVCIEARDLRPAGDLFFRFVDGYSIRGYVFTAESWRGEPQSTREADPFWCPEDEIPFDKMWADDSWWLPLMLKGCRFRGRFVFDGEIMLSMSVDAESSDIESGLPRNPVQEPWAGETSP